MVMGLWCFVRGFYLALLLLMLIKKSQHQITLQKMILVKEKSLGVNRIRKVMLANLFVDRYPISWLSILLLVVTGAGLVFYYDREKKQHIEEIHNASEAVKQGPSAGKAAIGGPFHLINHDGKYVTEKDFMEKWTLIYFGFNHCPDICPDELVKLAAAIDKIKEKAGIEIVPVFIFVDPERDTIEQVHEYVKEFHPKLIGLTSTSDEIKSVAHAYHVYYMKTVEEDSDYLVDHSIVM